MTDSGPASGTTPSGGWRHRPRPVRAVRDDWSTDLDGTDLDVSRGDRPDGAPPPEACPWLFLAAEPNARAGFVTDTHRCELRPDVVPGPGHQLAYCLATNHISCPQLRSYEGRRQAGADAQPEPPTAPTASDPPLAVPGSAARRAEWTTRAPWILAGGLAALGLALMLALVYSAPSPTAVTPPAAVPTTAPPATPVLPEAAPQPSLPTPSGNPLDQTKPGGATANPPASNGDAAADPALASAASPPPAGDPVGEAAAAPRLVPYVVVPGDTLLLIAWRFGVALDDLLAANGLGFQSTIYYGQQLLLPLPAGVAP